MKIKKTAKRILLTLASIIALGTLGIISANYNPVNAIIETTQELTEAKNHEKDVIKKLATKGTINCVVDYTVANNGSPKDLHIKITYRSIADLRKKIAAELQAEANVNPEIYEVVFDGTIGKSTLMAEVAQRPEVSSQSTSQLTAQLQQEIAEELENRNQVTCYIQTPMNSKKFRQKIKYNSVDTLKRKILALVSRHNDNQDLSDYEVVFKKLNSATGDLTVEIKEKASESASTTTKSKDQSSSQESSTSSKKSSASTASSDKVQSDSQILTEDSESQQLPPDLPKKGEVRATVMYAGKSYLPQKTKIAYQNTDDLKELAVVTFASQDKKNPKNPENYIANLVRYDKESNTVTIEITENPILSQLPATGTVNLKMFYVDGNSNQKQKSQTSKITYDNVLDLNEAVLDQFAEKNNKDVDKLLATFVNYIEKSKTLVVSISDVD